MELNASVRRSGSKLDLSHSGLEQAAKPLHAEVAKLRDSSSRELRASCRRAWSRRRWGDLELHDADHVLQSTTQISGQIQDYSQTRTQLQAIKNKGMGQSDTVAQACNTRKGWVFSGGPENDKPEVKENRQYGRDGKRQRTTVARAAEGGMLLVDLKQEGFVREAGR